MSDSDETPADTATAPPEAETPAPEAAVPEAEASVEAVTAPDPEHAPEPEPAPPPETAEVAAAVSQLDEQEHAGSEGAAAEAEALVPVHEEAPAERPAADEKAEEPAKPKRSKAAKAKVAAETTEPAEPIGTVTPAEEPAEGEPKPESKKKWYAVKVQSGREDTIKSAILRKVAIEGLEEYFGGIEIPVEEEIVKKQVRVKDKKTGEYTTQERKVTKKKKKFHGYIFANVEFNDRILYLFRETPGVGDFLNVRGSPGNPIAEPMPEHEVQAMLTGVSSKPGPKGKVKVRLDFEKGDRVRIREGPFANSEGEVKVITEPKDPTDSPKITVVVTLWGRPVDVDLDHWQVEKV
ncbi:MAG: hypothetical protein J0I06_21470 [Planctomycetes bacterium]|nr:hypothetical protein [Planctomycetota bacterium]